MTSSGPLRRGADAAGGLPIPRTGRPVRRTGPPIGSPRTGTTTIRGTVTEGVESGCIVLVDDAGIAVANLQGWDLQSHPYGSRVGVTGTFQPDLMTTCQQGTPFEVRAVVSG